MTPQEVALGELLSLIEDYHDYNPGEVAYIDHPPTPVEFAKQVSKGLPCVYPAQQILQDTTAQRWTKEYLISAVKEKVEVAVTPNGRADSLCHLGDKNDEEQIFLQPANIDMDIQSLFKLLDASKKEQGPVYYLQSQNSNLTSTPLQCLLKDLPGNVSFAEGVLGDPEAINIWIGDERSVTSAHRDPYENLYVVLRGSKHFTLWPPVDEVCMDTKMVRTGRYTYDTSSSAFDVVMDESESGGGPQIPWVSVDPQSSREELNQKHLLYKHAKPFSVDVRAGQMLYLPSGWYHHVAQTCGTWDIGTRAPCIAVNYWYDMDYEGERYVMRQLISRLSRIVQK